MAAELAQTKFYLVIGGPGCGKGTQCEKIRDSYKLTHISTGDLIRSEIEKNTSISKQVKDLTSQGKLIPNHLMFEILKKHLIEKVKSSNGFLIDGFPREISQAVDFEKTIAKATKVLHFKVSDQTMKERLLSRAKTSGRADDTEAVILDRIKTHNTNIKPILDYFTKQKTLFEISAEGNVNEVYAQTKAVMDKK